MVIENHKIEHYRRKIIANIKIVATTGCWEWKRFRTARDTV